jgi:hypothetical protein
MRPPLGFCRCSRFASGIALGVALAALTFSSVPALPLTGAPQLGDRHSLVELGDRAKHLAHQLGGRRVVQEGAGMSAAMRSIPRSRSLAWPTSCTMRSRANRLAVSTMIVRTPLPSIRSSMAAKPGRVSMGSAPLTAAS